MRNRQWGAITPERVAEYITFQRDDASWRYQADDASMPARQAEGVAGLWNILSRHGTALLADEVGTGKTLQALGVLALLRRLHADARVLIMAPNRDICAHWQREHAEFERSHHHGGRAWRGTADVEHGESFCLVDSLDSLVQDVTDSRAKLFIVTIHSLSGLVRGLEGSDQTKRTQAAAQATRIRKHLKKALGARGFDLLVIDEAHYLRNANGTSQRSAAARALFGPADDRLAARTLLMTATPSHTSMQDISAILGYFTDVADQEPGDLLATHALRRLRRMQGLRHGHDKYSYRHEHAHRASFDGDPLSELFFALYQKRLVQQQSQDSRRYLYGYLEGFESFTPSMPITAANEEEHIPGRDFHGSPDTRILSELARLHQRFNLAAAHPKYDALVARCVPGDERLLMPPVAIHERKHLIFVRRIASSRELARRINDAYDAGLAAEILAAIVPPGEDPAVHALHLQEWKRSRWSRSTLASILSGYGGSDGDNPGNPAHDEQDAVDEDAPHPIVDDAHEVVSSRIFELFVTKTTGDHQRTDCSRFSLRLRRSSSVMHLLLEPASDYRERGYATWQKRRSGDKLRKDYAGGARAERLAVRSGTAVRVDVPGMRPPELVDAMPTLWSAMYKLLDLADRDQLNRITQVPEQAESFAQYLRNGFLFASPVVIALYCQHARFVRTSRAASAEQQYRDFVRHLAVSLPDSLALAYFRAAIRSFDVLYRTVNDDDRKDWHRLTSLTSPANFATGEVTDRQRLIMGFNSVFFPNVLVATSVLQEGVNLHLQCTQVHHYGIAWTAGANEQRVGRIDRLFGKVNDLLAKEGHAELGIHYPYLAGSFDEDQLASFLREKHIVEAQMDACQQPSSRGEIDLQHGSESWQEYLRMPRAAEHARTIPDPYPYRPDERPGIKDPFSTGRRQRLDE